MTNDHTEARLWADHGAEFSRSVSRALARLGRALRQFGYRHETPATRTARHAAR